MIIDSTGMKKIEAASCLSTEELMERAGRTAADEIRSELNGNETILILCGKGNNGGDGYVIANCLKDMHVYVCQVDGPCQTEASEKAFSRLDQSMIITLENLPGRLAEADVIIDCIYGFGFHGCLKPAMRKLFQAVDQTHARIFSIDINSGACADDSTYDPDAIVSEITYALDCRKPIHLYAKEHHLFQKVKVLDLKLPHTAESKYIEMNEEKFFRLFPQRRDNAYKGTYGGCTLIGGSYGMVGALSLNILGARTIGASYIHAVTTEEVYPMAAMRSLTTVFHPFTDGNWREVVSSTIRQARAIAFGSGCVNMTHKQDILDLVLQSAPCPVVLDAEAIRLLNNNYYILSFIQEPVILTPHIGEFSALINKPVSYIADHRVELTRSFARRYGCIVVLKGANTTVASPSGEVYVNQSGCNALAQAGSGDLLTGMITACLTQTADVYEAVCMAVWLHGHLAEEGAKAHASQNFDLSLFPSLGDAFFFHHGY
jgi:NAD(P)H-hydrate epimerase